MQKKEQSLAGSFSFCLPGLGQLYQKRYLRAAVFFVVFCLLQSKSKMSIWVPLLALFSGVEAFLAPGEFSVLPNRPRQYAFAAVGSVSLLFWILAFGPHVIPV